MPIALAIPCSEFRAKFSQIDWNAEPQVIASSTPENGRSTAAEPRKSHCQCLAWWRNCQIAASSSAGAYWYRKQTVAPNNALRSRTAAPGRAFAYHPRYSAAMAQWAASTSVITAGAK